MVSSVNATSQPRGRDQHAARLGHRSPRYPGRRQRLVRYFRHRSIRDTPGPFLCAASDTTPGVRFAASFHGRLAQSCTCSLAPRPLLARLLARPSASLRPRPSVWSAANRRRWRGGGAQPPRAMPSSGRAVSQTGVPRSGNASAFTPASRIARQSVCRGGLQPSVVLKHSKFAV